ncbi:hypothetical protein B0A48_17658 [Cryoendolithus antarcticus]|uniref:Uncharacterized protein n=1 Tax=Cryoendolithus antarcticus TaxID=1507870 RepID=A0A1V8SB77_9PEZI|nr:hypothetical protein B0A48_17658 [Cryoendolithus antarcticus]
MAPILTSGQDFKAEQASRYAGNVPSPPDPRVVAPRDQASSAALRDISMSEPLFPVPHGSAPSRQVDQSSSQINSPTRKRRPSLLTGTDRMRELTEVLEDLERQHNAIVVGASAAPDTHSETLSPVVALAPPLQVLRQREARFIRGARRFLDLIQAPILRDLLGKAVPLRAGSDIGTMSTLEHGLAYDLKSSESRTLPPLLELYYDEAGEVKLQGESLVNLDYWYTEEVSVRMLQEDQGLEVPVPDDVFHAEYLHKRALIEVALDRHIDEAERLRTQCIAAGLDLNAGMRVYEDSEGDLSEVLVEYHEDDVHSLSDPGPLIQPLEVGSSERLRTGGLTPAARSILGLARMNEHVSRWIVDVETPADESSQQLLLQHVEIVDDANEPRSMGMQSDNVALQPTVRHNPVGLSGQQPIQYDHVGVNCGVTDLLQNVVASIDGTVDSAWVDISKEEVAEALERLEGLDLATAPFPQQEARTSRRARDSWGQDTKDTNSTMTFKNRWSVLLDDTLANARAWMAKFLTAAPVTP